MASETEEPDSIARSIATDPVRQRRERVRRATTAANRTGYAFLIVAIVVFFVAVATDFTSTLATIITVALVAACVLLAPTIILGYAINAADRDDRERGL